MEHRYKNTADKQSTWFVIFFILTAITLSIVLAIILSFINKNYFIPTFFISLFPLLALAIALALYITSSKVKAKRGAKKLDLVIENFKKEYRVKENAEGFDYLLLTPYKICGITVKCYEGNISGMESDVSWRQSLAFKKKKNALPNPIKENEELINKLNKKYKFDAESVVVLISGNRGYINAKHLYSPNQLESLITPNDKRRYQEEDLEKIYHSL